MSDLIAGRCREIPLPSPLRCNDGSVVQTAGNWYNVRRPEIIELCERYLYGRIPPRPRTVSYELRRMRPDALNGKSERREVRIHLENNGIKHHVDVLWYLPRAPQERMPMILGINFKGNAANTFEDDIPGENPGVQAHRWPFEKLIDAGYSVMTACRHDFYPDHDAGRPDSIYRLWPDQPKNACRQTAISAWAFGASIMLDLALSESMIDPKRIWLHGHSRLGKAALWTTACDPRFAGCISNDSGTGGAALMREKLSDAESWHSMMEGLYWWFTPEMKQYADRENDMPLDMHFLAALTAPRPLLIASASEDRWADPFNEYRTAVAITEVYRLFGLGGLGDLPFPEPNEKSFGQGVGYYLREGKHDVTSFDWDMVLEFIKLHSNCR